MPICAEDGLFVSLGPTVRVMGKSSTYVRIDVFVPLSRLEFVYRKNLWDVALKEGESMNTQRAFGAQLEV